MTPDWIDIAWRNHHLDLVISPYDPEAEIVSIVINYLNVNKICP